MKNYLITICLLLISCFISAQTSQQVLKELYHQNVPNPDIVLAQARLETGNFTSKLCKQYHNLFGIKHNGRYARYNNWRQSVADYKKYISSRYHGGDYFAFLQRIGYSRDKQYLRKLKIITNNI